MPEDKEKLSLEEALDKVGISSILGIVAPISSVHQTREIQELRNTTDCQQDYILALVCMTLGKYTDEARLVLDYLLQLYSLDPVEENEQEARELSGMISAAADDLRKKINPFRFLED